MKKYYSVNGDTVTEIELRETPKFFINSGGTRYKKVDGCEHLAEYYGSPSVWRSTTTKVYDLDSPEALSLLENQRKIYFAANVSYMVKKSKMTYEQCVKINEFLGLGVE